MRRPRRRCGGGRKKRLRHRKRMGRLRLLRQGAYFLGGEIVERQTEFHRLAPVEKPVEHVKHF